MTRMCTARLYGLASLLTLVGLGCNSGPMGPNTTYRTAPPQTGNPVPVGQPPIASQPNLSPTGANSSVRVVPFAALPPHAIQQTQLQQVQLQQIQIQQAQNGVRPLGVFASNGQMIDGRSMGYIQRSARLPRQGGAQPIRVASTAATDSSQSNALAGGLTQSPQEDLRYRGGRTIQNLKFYNIYVGGTAAWSANDWKSIDKALAAAMADKYLNNVIVQYFNNQPVSSSFQGSFFLSGWAPTNVPKSDLERQVSGLYSSGAFKGMDLQNTVFNFMLPHGTILGDPSAGEQKSTTLSAAIPKDDETDSTGGLGGYHGSVHVGGATVYYAVGAYSERLPNGGTNGIPVFDQNWKNVVATFYHELQEARTDADVGDAAAGVGPNPAALCGWTSDSGNEIGDYPIAEATQLKQVFVEIPLADGSGTVPIQMVYSNAVHGPEGPIVDINTRRPFTGGPPSASGPSTPSNPPNNNPPTNGPSPAPMDPNLAQLNASWNQLEDFVKKAILRLAAIQ
jgi:hypothetical protein